MKRSDFIKILADNNIMYEIQDDIIVIDSANGSVDLNSLTTLPEGVKFENQGSVYLRSLDGKTIKYQSKSISIKMVDDYKQ